MKPAPYMLAATAALFLASACSQEAEAPANQQETADSNAMMPDPSNPYAQAEMQMMERMTAAQGANPSESWTRKMIEHHRGAIAMSEILLAQDGDPQVLEKARMTADMQRKEIAELEALLPSGSAAAQASGANPYAEAENQMHQRMMAAKGANPSETWTRKMIVHHRGGAEMSNVLLAMGGGDPRVLQKARTTGQKQTEEADELERMLRGEATASAAPPAEQMTADAAPAVKSQPKAQPAAKAKAETPKATPKAAEPAADPHAGHDMGNMSNMSR